MLARVNRIAKTRHPANPGLEAYQPAFEHLIQNGWGNLVDEGLSHLKTNS
jgi:phage tail protein X